VSSEGADPGVPRRNNSGEVPAGHPRVRRGRAPRLLAAATLAGVLAAGAAGCGGGDSSGATVTVYVAKPLCAAAKEELSSHGATAGSFKVAIDCLAPTEKAGGGVDLATNGSNSRRATEDSSSVATLEEAGPGTEFSRPILESAGIPLVTSPSGSSGMTRILKAVESAGSSNVRESVQSALESS
jgi:hypothetical protein